MNIRNINKRHYFKSDIKKKKELGISSTLLAVKNGIAYIRVVINNDWLKNYRTTAVEVAQDWKDNHNELRSVFGAKIFIVDVKNNPFKWDMMKMGMKVDYDISLGLIFGEEKLN